MASVNQLEIGSWVDLFVLCYVLLVTATLLGYLFYLYASSLNVAETERRQMAAAELRLAHISSLISAPDLRYLMKSRRTRRRLIRRYSGSLKLDVLEIIRTKPLGFTSVALVATFFLGYALIWVKASVRGHPKDLQFLSGLELSLIRSLGEHGVRTGGG